jgi:hypothetical protein
MSVTGKDGLGTTISMASLSGNLLSVDGPGLERGTINSSHMGTTVAETFIPKTLYDGGEVELTMEHDGSQTPPITGSAAAVVINWAGAGAGYKTTFSAFCTGYKPKAQIGERMEATLKLKVTGAVASAQS